MPAPLRYSLTVARRGLGFAATQQRDPRAVPQPSANRDAAYYRSAWCIQQWRFYRKDPAILAKMPLLCIHCGYASQ